MTAISALAVSAIDLRIDGTPWSEPASLLSARVATRLGAPDQCEVLIADPTGAGEWPPSLALGATLALKVIGEDADLFAGEVTAVQVRRGPDGTTTIRVRGYDRLHRLRKRQTLRVFESVTAGDVAATLIGDIGVTLADPGDGPRFARVVQHRQTDFDLLIEVAERAGLLVAPDSGDLRLISLDGFGEPTALHFGVTLYEATVEANLDRVASTVTAYGWDTRRAEVLRAAADSARSGRRADLSAAPDRVGVDGSLMLVDQPGESTDDLSRVAQLALDLAAARAVTLRGVAGGDANIRAGRRVKVSGLPAEADGVYVVGAAVHTVDANGYQSSFSTEPPVPRVRPAGTSITLGKVTSVDDPDGLGRVKITLPALGDLDIGWLGVLCPGAGKGRGIVALPDVDDTVAVALPHGAPEEGVVLGALYGAIAPPDPGVEDGKVVRWSLRTDDGQSIVIDDDDHSIRVQDKAGSYVELAPGTVRLHSASDLVMEAPSGGITIRAKSVDFEHSL